MSRPPKPKPDTNLWDQLGGYLSALDPVWERIALVGVAVGFIVVFLKWIWPAVKRARRTSTAISVTLIGRDEIREPATGRVIAPAVPGLAQRLEAQEMSLNKVVEVVDKLADASARLDAHDQQHASHNERLTRIESVLTDERILGRIEGIQLLRTIETVAQAEPTPPPEGERPD